MSHGPVRPAGDCAGFGLDAYRKELDDKGLAVAAAQEASLKSRRQLADVTKSESYSHTPVIRCHAQEPSTCPHPTPRSALTTQSGQSSSALGSVIPQEE